MLEPIRSTKSAFVRSSRYIGISSSPPVTESCCSLAKSCRPFSREIVTEILPCRLTRVARVPGRIRGEFAIPGSRIPISPAPMPPRGDRCAASLPSHIRKLFRNQDTSDSVDRFRRCAAMRIDGCILFQTDFLGISMGGLLVPASPMVHPAGKEWFVTLAQQILKCG